MKLTGVWMTRENILQVCYFHLARKLEPNKRVDSLNGSQVSLPIAPTDHTVRSALKDTAI